MTMSKSVAFSLLCVLFPMAILAEDISTAFGYTLGMPMSDVKVLSTLTAENGDKLHVVKPAAGSNLETVYLGRSKDGKQVGIIIGRSPPMPAADCSSQLSMTIDSLKQRYPDSGYYALDDNDMIYQKDRSIILGCQVTGELSRLVIEYRDELLLK